jgi:hypothetical protein
MLDMRSNRVPPSRAGPAGLGRLSSPVIQLRVPGAALRAVGEILLDEALGVILVVEHRRVEQQLVLGLPRRRSSSMSSSAIAVSSVISGSVVMVSATSVSAISARAGSA